MDIANAAASAPRPCAPQPLEESRAAGRMPLPRWAGAALTAAAACLLTSLYARASLGAPPNSDYASIVLEAQDILRGNVLLHGWTLTNVSFYATDLPFYAAALWLGGDPPALLHQVPAFIYALTVILAVWLAGRKETGRNRRLGMLASFLLLGLPSQRVAEIVLVGVDHVGTTLFMLLWLLALDAPEEALRSPRRLAGFGLLVALTLLSDLMALVVGLVPLLLVTAWRARQVPRALRAQEQGILVAALGGLLGGLLWTSGARLLGGYRTFPVPLLVTPLSDLMLNAEATGLGLMRLFHADIIRHPWNGGSLLYAVGGLGLGGVLLSVGGVLWRLRREVLRDRINAFLALSIAINLAAYLLNESTTLVVNILHSPPERYLVPCLVFSGVLVGRWGVPHLRQARRLPAALTAVGLGYGILFVLPLLSPAPTSPEIGLADRLAAAGLHSGYGNFWCSNLVTVESRGRVTVRPVSGMTGKIAPRRWFSQKNWYQGTPASFLVYSTDTFGTITDCESNVTAKTAEASFGRPSRRYQFGRCTVLVWDHDLTPELGPAPEDFR